MRWSPLLQIFFPHVKPDSFSPSTETSVPWEAICAYRLCDFPVYHKALCLHVSFSRLLDKPVAKSLHVALSVDDISDLETYVRDLWRLSFSLCGSLPQCLNFLGTLTVFFRTGFSASCPPLYPGLKLLWLGLPIRFRYFCSR